MRNVLSISLAFAAVTACAGSQPPQATSSTQGTTVVRTAVVTRVNPATSVGSPARLELRYDNGASAVVEITTSEVFKAGDKVRVTHARGTERIEKLDGN